MLEHITVEPKIPAKKTVIWLHGLGADGHDFEPIAAELKQENTRFIFPHAPHKPVTINGGYRMRAWFDITEPSFVRKIDWDGIYQTEKDVHHLIEKELKKGIPAEKIILAGFSQGGVMALFTGLRYTQKLGGIMALSTFFPMNDDFIKTVTVNRDTPIFLAHGLQDSVLPYSAGKQADTWLINHGCQVEWHEYNMAHQVCPEEIVDIKQWLEKL